MPAVAPPKPSPSRIASKRSFEASEKPNHSSPQKRMRLGTEEADCSAESIPQQPKPLRAKRPYASFLESPVELSPSSPTRKRYCPESVDSSVVQWVESAPASKSYRERHCRSDTFLAQPDADIICRRLTKSAPTMEYSQDADGYTVPPTPTSTRVYSYDENDDSRASRPGPAVSEVSSVSTGGRKSLVDDPFYRDNNLAENNIFIRDFFEELPEGIAILVDRIRKGRDASVIRQDERLHDLEMGAAEAAVENYFKATVFPDPGPSDCLKRIDKIPMAKNAAPNVGSKLKVSNPMPDMLYGYNRQGAFSEHQVQLRFMGNEMTANSQGLLCPFFVIEFKADGPGGSGSMWVATNQCLGGSASCVNIVERLNLQLRQCNKRPLNSAAFSIAMNGTEARLYVSWKHEELKYYARKVDSFLLQRPKDYVEFNHHVLNIIDWGKDERLKDIQRALDSLQENRRVLSEQAKSRPPPTSAEASSSSSKRRPSRGSNAMRENPQPTHSS
ncbi:hypothetical protein LSUE1_G004890 [Lachnellula suecica]|uniref:DUF7924 domain-containing protein n=1 Tax=Lachnellula suecica TaxID=602035 RepID=A0A8T9CSG0_9HELO|nr:hypothetical protein LSUE1_G004890 [Lachnellula suecica]